MLKAQILEQLSDLCDTRALDLIMGYKKTIPVHSKPFTLRISKGGGEAAVVAFNMTRQEFYTGLTYAMFAIVSCRAVVVALL